MTYNVGIIGATGAVGQEFLNLLVARGFPASNLRCFASARSVGKTLTAGGRTFTVELLENGIFAGLDIAFFAASGAVAREFAPEAVRAGCVVVDNSSAFRMDPAVPLVIPEINADALPTEAGIIANPNCSTAITLMGLCPLHRAFGLKRFFACTYQAVSGTGADAIVELEEQTKAWARGEEPAPSVYPHPIAFNLLPHVDVFLEDGYTREEHKMANESRKIMNLPDLKVSTTCVRVPVFRAHAIAVHAEFAEEVDLDKARAALGAFPGVLLEDDPANNVYPLPRTCSGREACGVGRLRRDSAYDNGLAFWVVGDQLWKGAALNAVQIGEALVARGNLRATGGVSA